MQIIELGSLEDDGTNDTYHCVRYLEGLKLILVGHVALHPEVRYQNLHEEHKRALFYAEVGLHRRAFHHVGSDGQAKHVERNHNLLSDEVVMFKYFDVLFLGLLVVVFLYSFFAPSLKVLG